MFFILTLLPKGALTSKPYSFKIRAWELSSLETVDSTDHFNSSIYVQYKNSKIIRVLPKKVKNSISLISDVSRYSFDSLSYNRPSLVTKSIVEYKKSFRDFNNKSLILTSNSLALGSLILLKFFEKTIKNISIRREIFSLRSSFLFWNSFNLFQCFETISKLCFVSSTALSVESILLNIKIRLKFNKKHFNIFYCGYYTNSTYSVRFLSLKLKPIFYLLKSKSFIGFYFFKLFKHITFIIGESLIRRFRDFILFFTFFKQRIKTCLFYFLAKQKNHLVTQLIPLKVINKRILNRVNKIFLTNLDDTLQMVRTVSSKISNTQLISFSSFNPFLSKSVKFLFPVSLSLESSGIFVDFEHKIKKSTKFSGIVTQNINTAIISCFSFFRYVCVIFCTYRMLLQRVLNYTFSKIILESLRNTKLSVEFILILKQINSVLNSFPLITYPDKMCFEDRFRYSLSTKNSVTMLNCSRDERKQSSNF